MTKSGVVLPKFSRIFDNMIAHGKYMVVSRRGRDRSWLAAGMQYFLFTLMLHSSPADYANEIQFRPVSQFHELMEAAWTPGYAKYC